MKSDDLFTLTNVTDKSTGLTDMVIWCGPNERTEIKVSNVPNKLDGRDLFVITIPDLKVVGQRNQKFITDKKLKQIFKFIELNEQAIIDHCYSKTSSFDFLMSIKSV